VEACGGGSGCSSGTGGSSSSSGGGAILLLLVVVIFLLLASSSVTRVFLQFLGGQKAKKKLANHSPYSLSIFICRSQKF
jgi:hypothetical protein